MAPPPEYDKEPKAPDKSATNISSEDSKALFNLVTETQTISDTKATNSNANAEVENNKHVEALDDGQLRALLDEAITYKCPKDREGKSNLFKELLESVEQDEQACEAAARLPGRARRAVGGRGRRALPHSNSLQDLVAALAAEPAPRRARHHNNHAPAPVSARALHGGSLPSGVDTCAYTLNSLQDLVAALAAEPATRRARHHNNHAPAPVSARALHGGSLPSGVDTCAYTLNSLQDLVAALAAEPATRRARHHNNHAPAPVSARALHGGSLPSGVDTCAYTLNSLQDLVAALAAEPATRSARLHNNHAPAPVSARALHCGSLPTGVDTSFLLSEEPMRGVPAAGGAEYVATVRCVNPSPLAERRVSASDAHNSHETEPLNRRSKPFPMTYTARASLEIGSGGAGAGRAVTTTTASNQVRTVPAPRARAPPACGHAGRGGNVQARRDRARPSEGKKHEPRGPPSKRAWDEPEAAGRARESAEQKEKTFWRDGAHVERWYRGLEAYRSPPDRIGSDVASGDDHFYNRRVDSRSPRLPDPGTGARLARLETDPGDRDPFRFIPKTSIVNTSRLKLTPLCKAEHIPVVRDDGDAVEARKCPSMDIDHGNELGALAGYDEKENEDAIHRRKYREQVGRDLVAPSLSSINPPNVRSMTIGRSLPLAVNSDTRNRNLKINQATADKTSKDKHYRKTRNRNNPNANVNVVTDKTAPTVLDDKSVQSVCQRQSNNPTLTKQIQPSSSHNRQQSCSNMPPKKYIEDNDSNKNNGTTREVPRFDEPKTENDTELVEMVSLKRLPSTDDSNEFSLFIANQKRLLQALETNVSTGNEYSNEMKIASDAKPLQKTSDGSECIVKTKDVEKRSERHVTDNLVDPVIMMDCSADKELEDQGTEVGKIKGAVVDFKVSAEKSQSTEVPSDASIFLTLYKRLLASPCNIDNPVLDIKGAADSKPVLAALEGAAPKPPKKKKDKITSRLSRKPHNENSNKKRDIIRNALKKLFFDNITQSDSTKLTGKASASATTSKEVDSAIPFSCITTPEVAASCNTTASPAAVPVDLKIPRNALTSSFATHGVPLPRAGPAFGAAAAVAVAAAEEFKKSLDENGNSLQGFSSPQAGSGQQKKQRRKKSTRNETVIKSHQIDGYQGNKDLNEVLRFIESAEPERGAKRHDDKKKRSAERRKDKAPRASSLDDLSRAAAAPPHPAHPARAAPAKPERRSWGDDARAYFREPEPDALELTDFQTVTKKRRPRRRADGPPRAPSPGPRGPASPRARSDRSNDSNDDGDSVRSLPALPARAAPAAPAPPPASYADIARTRHNIPDLIESCNYYAEGEAEARAASAAAGDADAYPALDGRARRVAKPPGAAAPRRAPKERAEPPAPDVVADRRPPVVLLDAAAHPRDMDGVTFGFDVNEQLLGGARRPPCDPPPPAPAPSAPLRAGCAALRYVEPAAPLDAHHLHQIVDYVGTAWEDVVRCGGGKVRYFSE